MCANGIFTIQLLQKGQMDQATKKARLLLAKEAQANRLEETADAADLIALQINMNSKETMAQRVLQDGTRIMQSAQKHSNLEKSLATAEQYKEQVEEFKLRNDFYQEAVADSTSTQVNNDAVQDLISKLADGVGLDLKQELDKANPSRAEPVKETNEPTAEAEDVLKERLRALRA